MCSTNSGGQYGNGGVYVGGAGSQMVESQPVQDPMIYPGLYAPSGFDIMDILVCKVFFFPFSFFIACFQKCTSSDSNSSELEFSFPAQERTDWHGHSPATCTSQIHFTSSSILPPFLCAPPKSLSRLTVTRSMFIVVQTQQ